MNIYLCIVFSILLASLGLYKKAFTKFGLLVAFIISILICYCGSYIAFGALVTLFIITIATDKIGKTKKINIEKDKHNKNDKRDVFQVLANLLVATIFIIIYKLTSNNKYMVCFLVSLAESAADTSASGIGILSKKSFNVLTFKKSEKGLSGNVSILGFVASFIAAFIIGSIYLFKEISIYIVLVITIIGFVGALIDSILGCYQVKYKCLKCNTITEKTFHCKKQTSYYKGIKYLNNDLVNILSNVISCIICFIIC